MGSHTPAADGPQRSEEKRCSHCGTRHTSSYWRQHPASGQQLCNACGQYADNHGGQLPPDSVLQRRPAQPRRMEDVRREIAQRSCLQCGSDSPGSGKGAHWRRHPATGEEWVCGACCRRIYDQLIGGRSHKRKTQQQAVYSGSSAGEATDQEEEHEKAAQQHGQNRRRQRPESSTAQRQCQPPKRKKQEGQQEAEDEGPEAGHEGSSSTAKKRARGSSSAGWEPVQQNVAPQGHAGGSSKGTQPAAKRRQRRKQTQPQHLPVEPPAQLEQQPAPTLLVEGTAEPAGSAGPATASLHGSLAAAGPARAEGIAGTGSLGDSLPQQAQQAAAPEAEQQQQVLPPQPEPEQALSILVQDSTDVAAAAASGLSPELAAAFVMLLPLEAQKEAYLRRLLQRGQYSAAAVQMRMAVHLAGFALPG